MTPITTVTRRRQTLRRSHVAFHDAIREAVAANVPKVDVAKAAGISRPTLDRILRS